MVQIGRLKVNNCLLLLQFISHCSFRKLKNYVMSYRVSSSTIVTTVLSMKMQNLTVAITGEEVPGNH